MKKRLLTRNFFFVILVLILVATAAFATSQVNAQNQYATNIADRLSQRGVPVKHVTTISRIPYVIEIALQSSSDDDNLVIEDNWFLQLADREATLAYRISKRLSSYQLTMYNAKGKLIYSMQAYLHPEDLNQQLDLSISPKINNFETEEIVAGELQFNDLHLDKLEVLLENAMGSDGQILLIQASAKDVEAANQSLPGFLDSLFYTLETVNAEHGAYIVLCHFQLLDSQGKVLMDYARDLESGSTRWKPVQGLYNGWFPQPVVLETASPLPTSATPSTAYPAPSDLESSSAPDFLSSTPQPYP